MQTVKDQTTASQGDENDDWHQMNVADLAEYDGLPEGEALPGLLELTDRTIAGNAYLLSSDIVFTE